MNERGVAIGVATLSIVDGQNLNFAVSIVGGPVVRSVDWTIADVGKLALSDLDVCFLSGPVRRVVETCYDTSVCPKGPGPYVNSVFDTTYNANGMAIRSSGTSNHRFADRVETWSRETDYFDARIPRSSRRRSEGKPDAVEAFTYERGSRFRADAIRLCIAENEGPSQVTTDSLGRWVEVFYPEFVLDTGEVIPPGRKVTRFLHGDRRASVTYISPSSSRIASYTYSEDAYRNWIKETEDGCLNVTRFIEYHDR